MYDTLSLGELEFDDHAYILHVFCRAFDRADDPRSASLSGFENMLLFQLLDRLIDGGSRRIQFLV